MTLPQERIDESSRHVVREFERRCAGVALLASPLFAAVGWMLGSHYRAVLFLQASDAAVPVGPAAIIAATALAALPVCWWLGCQAPNRQRFVTNVVIASVAVLITFVVGAAIEHPKLRFTLQEAVKARAPQLDFVRNLTFKQQELDHFADAPPAGMPRVALIGSSQINLGIDTMRLKTATGSDRVLSVCMPGMVPMQYLALSERLIRQRPTHVVCWLSEFDFFRESDLPVVRMRWCSDRGNVRSLSRTLPADLRWEHRSELADLAFASVSPTWRSRSQFRLLAFRWWWSWNANGQTDDPDEAMVGGKLLSKQQGLANVSKNIRRTSLVDAHFASFEQFASALHEADIGLIVIEGESHPEAMTCYPAEFRCETRRRLTELSRKIGFEYYNEEQRPEFIVDDWRDAVHLNKRGRDRLTAFVVDLI